MPKKLKRPCNHSCVLPVICIVDDNGLSFTDTYASKELGELIIGAKFEGWCEDFRSGETHRSGDVSLEVLDRGTGVHDEQFVVFYVSLEPRIVCDPRQNIVRPASLFGNLDSSGVVRNRANLDGFELGDYSCAACDCLGDH